MQAAANRPVWLSILGLSWFWAIGATLLSEFPSVARDALGAEGQVVTLLLTMFAVGIGVGSMLCARLLHGEVSARHVPFAAFGITLFTWDFGCDGDRRRQPEPGDGRRHAACADRLAHAGRSAAAVGLRRPYSVPLYAIVQEQSEPSHRARTIAANNIVNAVMMVLGAGSSLRVRRRGLSAPRVLQVPQWPTSPSRCGSCGCCRRPCSGRCSSWYFRLFHGPGSRGWRISPLAGERSIVVINHLSFLDGCLVAAFVPGDLVFAIDTDQARRFWFLKYVHRYFSDRSEQPDGDPRDGEGGARRAAPGDLSRRAHHADRRADEDL